jgi:hypothetical protein
MVTLRCTQKLLRRLHVHIEPDVRPPTTVLGNWYGNILYLRPRQLVLWTCERTLLPIVTVAKEFDSLPVRLALTTRDVLIHLGVPQELAEREASEMREFEYGPTESKRILGSMNDFMFQLSWLVQERPKLSLLQMSLHLAENPCRPIGYKSPIEVTKEVFCSGLSNSRRVH